jgi:hypothetical protein
MRMIDMIQTSNSDLQQLKVDVVYSKGVSFFGVCSKHFLSAEDEYKHLQSIIVDGHITASKGKFDGVCILKIIF